MSARRSIANSVAAFLQVTVAVSALYAASLPDSEKKKIEALIESVASAREIRFVRNGRAYDSATAATFLRRKWQANASEVSSARDFIEKIASFSGTSGNPYLIRRKDGSEITSREFLFGQLTKME